MQKIFAPCSTSAFGIVQAMEKRIRDRSEGKLGRRAFSGFLPPLAVQRVKVFALVARRAKALRISTERRKQLLSFWLSLASES